MKLYFQKIGNGPALIILHGLYGMSDNWMSFARQLSKDFTIYLVDQRNHGRSPHDMDHSYQAMSLDLYSLINSEGIDKATVLGHSMGGKTAMLFALLYPEKVKRLIIVDIAPVNYASVDLFRSQVITHLNIVNAMLSVDFEKVSNRTDIQDELEKTIKDTQTLQFILKNVHRNHDGTYCWKLNIKAIANALPLIMNFPVKDVYNINKSLFNIPVLFLKGSNSEYILPEHVNEINSLFPMAKIETIADAGHWIHVDQPLLFIEKITNFLQNKYHDFSEKEVTE